MKNLTVFFAAAPRFTEDLLARELSSLGAESVEPARSGVRFQGSLETAYGAVIHSRIASRVLAPVLEFQVKGPDDLYQHALEFPFEDFMPEGVTFLVDSHVSGGVITHSQFAALRVKDALVDRARQRGKPRPSVCREQPDVIWHLTVKGHAALLSMDLGHGSLHRRGNTGDRGTAPMKENLAAAVLMRAGWCAEPEKAALLVDPMCGSGTLLMEAVAMALGLAPELQRGPRPRPLWIQERNESWSSQLDEARQQFDAGRKTGCVQVLGMDADPVRVRQAMSRLREAHLSSWAQVLPMDLFAFQGPESLPQGPGMLVCNPPYGHRLGVRADLIPLYGQLGNLLRTRFRGWSAHLLTADPSLTQLMRIRAVKKHALFNGPIACELLHFRLDEDRWEASDRRVSLSGGGHAWISEQGEMFANRLEKNFRHLRKWLKKNEIHCFRVYDRDLPDYGAVLDVYRDYLILQEYQAPKNISPLKASQRLAEMILAAPAILNIPGDHVIVKTRKTQRPHDQYTSLGDQRLVLRVKESGLIFEVNLSDYVDTGLFLDHRRTRTLIRDAAAGKRVLNLFAYTGSFSVAAAAGGAERTCSVDMSRTYLEWAQRNMQLNGYRGGDHQFIQADCLEWVKSKPEPYDLIVLDPPSFSNSKRMRRTWDLKRDHVPLLRDVCRWLAPQGKLVFACHRKGFNPDKAALEGAGFDVRDITAQTLDRDFQSKRRAHICLEITRQGSSS